jgi:penicillin G amidase
MKRLKKFGLIILSLVVIFIGLVYAWMRNSKPLYEGSFPLKGLQAEVIIHYDKYGVPSIQAQNKHDLYQAFGYRHAAERLFQMDLLRRVGSGRLAEFFGQPVIKVDHLFRTLGTPEYARQSAAYFETLKGQPIYDDVQAYLTGVNQFVQNGDVPREYGIIGITPEPFGVEDIYFILGAMSFSFSQGQKTEFIMDYIAKNCGEDYIRDLALYHDNSESFIPSSSDSSLTRPLFGAKNDVDIELHHGLQSIAEALPVSSLEGSNAWVVGGKKTKSGKVLFCNDTHIGYNLPQTWYEAHLTCPGFEMYGHFMAGIPFALVGRNQRLSWGLTMLLNDDVDFYREQIKDQQMLNAGQWHTLHQHTEKIKVKGGEDTLITIQRTIHGPIINDALRLKDESTPISIFWSYTQKDNRNIDALYTLNNAQNMKEFEAGLPLIHAPGLNVNYGDADGNVAWWACAHLLKRPAHVNSWTVLDGASGRDEFLGYYNFDQNPKNINPEKGYIYSANDWPQRMQISEEDSIAELWYPGYYKPQYRADRIVQLLDAGNDWDMENIKSVMNDHTNPMDAKVMREIFSVLEKNNITAPSSMDENIRALFDWDGKYDPQSSAPTLFNALLYHIMQEAIEDEISAPRYQLFIQTHQMQRAYGHLFFLPNSRWWDDVRTNGTETRDQVFIKAYNRAIERLKEEYGDNPNEWKWANAAKIEIKHPLGEVALFRPFFNLGPREVYGGNESIRQAGYYPDSSLHYKVFYGSQMRIITDFAHPDSALNISPAGQSGNVMSAHYGDQFEMYLRGEFRTMRMNRVGVEGKTMRLYPN